MLHCRAVIVCSWVCGSDTPSWAIILCRLLLLLLLLFLVLWVMKLPRPPHHEEPRGEGREPDDAHPNPDSDADLVTAAERPIAWC